MKELEIIKQTQINKDDLFKSLNETGSKLLIDTLPKLFSGKVSFQNQNEQYTSNFNNS